MSMKSEIDLHNRTLFEEFRRLDLRQGEYAITSSGPLGVRNIRKINDIDILLTDGYWGELKSRFAIFNEDGFIKLRLSNNVEAIYSGSFDGAANDSKIPTVKEQIQKAEQIQGMYFVSLEHIVLFKELSKRQKDKEDIELINKWLFRESD